MRALPILVAAMLFASPAGAIPEDVSGRSGAAVPRFVSLRSGEANVRAGPGDQYPIRWTYTRRGLPLEIVREWGPWRQVRDPGGALGWINKGLLSGERHVLVTRAVRALHVEPDTASPVAFRVEPGVVARVLYCERAWCRVSVDGRGGHIARAHVWGTYPGEAVD